MCFLSSWCSVIWFTIRVQSCLCERVYHVLHFSPPFAELNTNVVGMNDEHARAQNERFKRTPRCVSSRVDCEWIPAMVHDDELIAEDARQRVGDCFVPYGDDYMIQYLKHGTDHASCRRWAINRFLFRRNYQWMFITASVSLVRSKFHITKEPSVITDFCHIPVRTMIGCLITIFSYITDFL